jgi:hypothetical protein
MRVEPNVIRGCWSAQKKSVPSMWASRSGWLVSTEDISIVASTRVSARVSPTLSVASKRLNRPRTLDKPMWRTLKWTPEWLGSTAQVPAARGKSLAVEVTVDVAGSVLMGLPCDVSYRGL